MKKLLAITLLSTSLFLGKVYAQGISAGLRTGVGTAPSNIWTHKTNTIKPTWDKEGFIRYEAKKRLAFEASATQYNYSSVGVWTYGCFATYTPLYFNSPPYENLHTINNYNVIDISLRAQYDVSSKKLQENCTFMKKIKNYIGVEFTGTVATQNRTQTNRNHSDGAITEDSYKRTSFADLSIGLNHTVNYYFNQFYITSTGGYKISTNVFQGYDDPFWPTNNRLSMLVGVGYVIK